MRLTKEEIRGLREALDGLPVERVFLFGSRTDDARRGGDIDVLLFPRLTVNPESYRDLFGNAAKRERLPGPGD